MCTHQWPLRHLAPIQLLSLSSQWVFRYSVLPREADRSHDRQPTWLGVQDALGVDSFSSSEHAYAAEDLFNAYQNADADAVKKCISSKSAFLDLDNQVGCSERFSLNACKATDRHD